MYLDWIMEFAYATVVVSAFQGALAERTNLSAYVIISFLLASFVYPVILAWTWGDGWLSDKGFHDFSGSGVVHLVAGTTALWGAIFLGERRSKVRAREDHNAHKVQVNPKSPEIQHQLNEINPDFSNIAKKAFKNNEGELASNNNAFIVLGTLLIWTAYFFFVGGRTFGQFNPRAHNSAKIIQNMFIASSFSALVTIVIRPIALGLTRTHKFDVLSFSNGALVGMVAISASVDRVENWEAVLIGTIAAFSYVISLLTLDFYRIDDPLETISVHFAGGVWGLFATGFFDTVSGVLFYGSLNQGPFMGYQLVAILVIVLFVSVIMVPTFYILRKLHILRVDKAIEEIGFDVAYISPGVSKEFIDVVRDKIETREQQEKKIAAYSEVEVSSFDKSIN